MQHESKIAGKICTRFFHEKYSQHANNKQSGGPKTFHINLLEYFLIADRTLRMKQVVYNLLSAKTLFNTNESELQSPDKASTLNYA